MNNTDRAVQFAPFASLRGFYGMIDSEEETVLTAAEQTDNEPDGEELQRREDNPQQTNKKVTQSVG
ncbi:MAG: hypothetical protein IJE90_01925 [Clostridia bacterium]|nr:hypothetical protein [Clostridia bacterium]